MTLRRALSVVAACATAAGLSILATGAAQATPSVTRLTHLSWRQFYALPAAQQAAVQNPLMKIATPIQAAAASTAMARIFSAVALDVPHNAVDVYVTNLAQGRRLLAAAALPDRTLDLGRVVLRKTAYSAAALAAAARRVNAAHLPFRLYEAADVSLGASLQLRVPDPAAAARLASVRLASLGGRSVRELAGVKLTFTRGSPVRLASRENDDDPFIGGDLLYGWNGTEHAWVTCTAGIPVEDSAGEDYLLTANHCFEYNNNIYTQNYGHHVGLVTHWSAATDSELIDTGLSGGQGSNADEGESDGCSGICYHALDGTDSSWAVNEDFCQDGIVSYAYGYGVECHMHATGYVYPEICGANGACTTVQEVNAESNNTTWIVFTGDSGAVVFTVPSSSTRNAAGLVSTASGNCQTIESGPFPGTTACTEMGFVFAPTLYSTYKAQGIHLNPHT